MLYIETTVTLIVRIIDRKNIFSERHNYHAYQQLIVSHSDHSLPARYSIVIFLFYLLPLSFISYTYQGFIASVGVVLFTIIPLAFFFYFYGPMKARENQKNA
jgi:VIT1/CCC1 family predicted Fe2+/Mn2+ transporter